MASWTRWRLPRVRDVGPRVTVVIVSLVGVLSLVTGVAKIIGLEGLIPVFPPIIPREIQEVAGFTGALTGFLMLGSAFGLRRGLRAAWYSTIVLLPLTAIQGFVQLSPLSVPLIVLSLVAMPSALVHRQHFDRAIELTSTQLAAGAAIAGAQSYGTVGTYALREDFENVSTVIDAFYYTLITASTVGYGDLTPQSQRARLFAMSVVIVGTASFGIALGTLLGPAIEARFSRALGRMSGIQFELLEDHILVLGYGDLTEPLLEELHERTDSPVIVITPETEHATELQDHEYDVLVADPSDEEPLERTRIGSARAVVAATNDDADDALSVLTARKLNPDVPIVAAATNRGNVEKLRRAGADTVISPAVIGSRLLVESALGAQGMEDVADRVMAEAEGSRESAGK